MRPRSGAGVATVNRDPRLVLVLAGERDRKQVRTPPRKTQAPPFRRSFARAAALAFGPKRAVSSWVRFSRWSEA